MRAANRPRRIMPDQQPPDWTAETERYGANYGTHHPGRYRVIVTGPDGARYHLANRTPHRRTFQRAQAERLAADINAGGLPEKLQGGYHLAPGPAPATEPLPL